MQGFNPRLHPLSLLSCPSLCTKYPLSPTLKQPRWNSRGTYSGRSCARLGSMPNHGWDVDREGEREKGRGGGGQGFQALSLWLHSFCVCCCVCGDAASSKETKGIDWRVPHPHITQLLLRLLTHEWFRNASSMGTVKKGEKKRLKKREWELTGNNISFCTGVLQRSLTAVGSTRRRERATNGATVFCCFWRIPKASWHISYALAGFFPHLCQSSHGTRITEKECTWW